MSTSSSSLAVVKQKPKDTIKQTEISVTGRSSSAMTSWRFQTDYNDHFETPLIAYQDIRIILSKCCEYFSKSPRDLIIYDPYYCQGSAIRHLDSLGYVNVINQNRDFYVDIAKRLVPGKLFDLTYALIAILIEYTSLVEYDILITNPPYSGEHKQKLFDYLAKSKKPFALLLPAYVATKSYYREFLSLSTAQSHKRKHQATLATAIDSSQLTRSMLYLMPAISYEYHHPEGTGKDHPPFYSTWFIGNFPDQGVLEISLLEEKKRGLWKSSVTVLTSVDQMIARGYVQDKRPNPKARKRLKAKLNRSH
jgi:hypothetical protein